MSAIFSCFDQTLSINSSSKCASNLRLNMNSVTCLSLQYWIGNAHSNAFKKMGTAPPRIWFGIAYVKPLVLQAHSQFRMFRSAASKNEILRFRTWQKVLTCYLSIAARMRQRKPKIWPSLIKMICKLYEIKWSCSTIIPAHLASFTSISSSYCPQIPYNQPLRDCFDSLNVVISNFTVIYAASVVVAPFFCYILDADPC